MSSEEDNFDEYNEENNNEDDNVENENDNVENENEEENEEEIEEEDAENEEKQNERKKENSQKKKKITQIIEERETEKGFETFGLDPRILKAIAKANFAKPTIVQTAAIPLALKGKDILAKAKTGSGKTAAYAIPILQQLISEIEKNNSDNQRKKGVRVLILVPSAELCAQVYQQLKQLTLYTPFISFLQLARSIPIEVQKTRLAEMPDIVISTPSQLIPHLREKDINLKEWPGLGWIVLDEADLLMSYGYEEDLKEIASHLPKAGCQSFLMSATLTSTNDEDLVETLKDLILNNPAILQLEEAEMKDKDLLQQFTISCKEEDKFLVLFVLIKLRLIRGKIIFFVNEIDRCYRLKLFFERFSIKSAVMNSELPQTSRNHIIMEFNKGVFDYLIATDENLFNTNQKQGKRRKDKEYLVARGVDFKFVKAVINFDLPPTKEAYVHRIGRTARGGTRGLALSFVTEKNKSLYNDIKTHVEEEGYELKPFSFNMDAIEGFRYRVEDVSRSVTKAAIREARVKELKAEVMNSAKLKAHFEDNPQDLSVLQHDQTLQQSKVQPHLRTVPDYLLNDVKKKGIVAKQPNKVPIKRKWEPKKSSSKSDPLKTFSYKKRKTDFD